MINRRLFQLIFMQTIEAQKYCLRVTDGTHDSPKESGDGFFLITSRHLRRFSLDYENAYRISKSDYDKINERSKVEQWDILFSMIGTIGNLYIETNPNVNYACKNVGIFKMGGNKQKALWLFYYLQSSEGKAYIKAHLRGTTQMYVPLDSLRQLPIPVYDEKRTATICKILYGLDRKIELNSKINGCLLDDAKAIFNSFYDADNEHSPLSEIIDVLGGGTPKTKVTEYWDGAIPFFGPGDATDTFVIETEKHISQLGLDNCNSALYPVGTTFITARGTVGKTCLVGVPMAMNQSCFALKPKRIAPELAYLYVQKSLRKLLGKANGAVFDALTSKDIKEETINRLDGAVETEITRKVKPLFDLILDNQFANQRLNTLRNSLLPKLMSGEIDVDSIRLDQ